MGGVAILVRARIKQQVIPNLNLLSLEAVAVLIKLNNRYVTIVSAYQPPSRQMQMSDYDKVMNLDNSIIMAGDLNAKHTNWGCRVINPNGTKLLSFIANTPYTNYAPNEPTYFPSDVNRQPDILDILLIKSFPLICTQEALAELDSDHIPVHKLLDLPDYSVQNCKDYVTPNEVKLIVKNLPNKKPPGHDHLTNLMFKKLPAKGIVLMTSLFNFLLRVGHFPLSWKIATIILIKKPGKNKSNPDSYRPISLLTSLSKIFEKVIHTRLLNYLNSAEVIPKFQFGFRPNHSTIQQLFRITEHISNSFEKHCHTGAIFIDVSKAFDKFSSRSQSSRHFKKKKNTRTSSDALTPPYTSKNRFSPLLTIQVDDNTDGIANEVSTQQSQVRPKIPPIYVYNISDYENFHTSLANITFDEFSIANTKSALKVNMDSIDDYRTATKLFDDSGTEYHTYQFPENKQLSVIIRNLPVNMSEACIYKELVELKFEVASVTRLQNKFKTPIPIVAILLSKSSTEIYSLNRLLHCVVTVDPRQPSKGIPQCTNCQRFSHTKKFCHLPPRCVKCAGDHHYSSCPKEIETPPKCVNCLSDHPATYRGCTFYKEISKDKKNATQFKNNYTKVQFPVNISNITQNDVTDKRSYAAATKNKSQDKSFNNTDNDFMKTLLPLINTFISQLLQKIIENLPAILNSVHLNPNGSP
ncbi:hypothetical protein QTP88_006336 [Uroleucon formosanum]